MAELDFSHNVSEIPAGERLPKGYQRQESAQVTQFPDLQSAISTYAADTNWMSSLGSAVAAKAANATAQKIGGQLGKNPQGDLGIPLTDFDQAMQESYKRQSQATLGLQADELITKSNLEAAKADRITPELIQKTNQSISIGLQNIFKNAPSEIVPELQYQYGQKQLSLASSMSEKMIGQQKEDRKNNAAAAGQMYSENAYSFGINGNVKAGQAAVESAKRLAQSQVETRDLTPEEAKTRIDSTRQSYLSGSLIHDYEKARSAGNGEAFLKAVADNKAGLSNADFLPVTNNLMNYVNHQDALRSQDEQLRLAKFNTSLATNPLSPDIASQLADLKNTVSADSYEKAQLKAINTINQFKKEQGDISGTIAAWNDPSLFARQTDKAINKAFDMQTQNLMVQSQKKGQPITEEEAKVQVAYSAGGQIPIYQKELEDKLTSANPIQIESAARQMQMLQGLEAGRAYAGVSQKAKAIGYQFMNQRGTMPDTELARKITDNLSNIDEATQKTLDNAWDFKLAQSGAGGLGMSMPLYKFALQQVGIRDKNLGGDYFAVLYGNDIYNQFHSNFITTRGDYATAKQMTMDYVKEHYGDTYVNGKRQLTDSPVEKALGYQGNDATPFIQQDVLNQLAVAFQKSKDLMPGEEWSTLPLKDGGMEVKRTVETKSGKKEFTYPVKLVGKAGNQWDVVLQTPSGNHNLFLVAPQMHVTSYIPNAKAIRENYAANANKGWF